MIPEMEFANEEDISTDLNRFTRTRYGNHLVPDFRLKL